MSKKWTKWVEHNGDECPVDGDEVVRVRFRPPRFSKQFRTDFARVWHWGRITHYKRLKSNVAAEQDSTRTSKLSAKFDDTKPIITGPEEYMTAIGLKAVIDHLGFNTPWAATSTINTVIMSWNQWGSCRTHNLDYHITGPWEEPKTENPEQWANLYRDELNGKLILGVGRFQSPDHMNKTPDRAAIHIGLVFLNQKEVPQ